MPTTTIDGQTNCFTPCTCAQGNECTDLASNWSAWNSPVKSNLTWRDLIGPHSWLRGNNSRIGMTPDPSSLVKGLARQQYPETLHKCLDQTMGGEGHYCRHVASFEINKQQHMVWYLPTTQSEIVGPPNGYDVLSLGCMSYVHCWGQGGRLAVSQAY